METEKVTVTMGSTSVQITVDVPSTLEEAVEVFGKSTVVKCFNRGLLQMLRVIAYQQLKGGFPADKLAERMKSWRPFVPLTRRRR